MRGFEGNGGIKIGMLFGLKSIIFPCSVLELYQFKDFARLLDHPVHTYIQQQNAHTYVYVAAHMHRSTKHNTQED